MENLTKYMKYIYLYHIHIYNIIKLIIILEITMHKFIINIHIFIIYNI